jgi:hypothetical protein
VIAPAAPNQSIGTHPFDPSRQVAPPGPVSSD